MVKINTRRWANQSCGRIEEKCMAGWWELETGKSSFRVSTKESLFHAQYNEGPSVGKHGLAHRTIFSSFIL
jgi:hypothetical protein